MGIHEIIQLYKILVLGMNTWYHIIVWKTKKKKSLK